MCSAALGVIALNAQFFGSPAIIAVSVDCEAGGLVHHSLTIESPKIVQPEAAPEAPISGG
jgi:hypothetical protein